MAKTLKDCKDWIDTYENPTESEQELIDGFKDILDKIFANYKNELAEKDKEMKKMKNNFIPLYEWVESQSDYLEELKQQQLYKEDFKKMITTSYSSKGHTSIESWELKDNSKYDKLPSKDVK